MSKNSKLLKRVAAIMLAGSMAVSTAFPSNILTASAASKKTVSSIKVAAAKKTITAGKSATVKVTVKGAKKASKKFTVKSSNKKVAKAKVSGAAVKITAVKAGKATITVTTKAKNKKGKKLSKKINVTVKSASKSNSAASTTAAKAAATTATAATTTTATATTTVAATTQAAATGTTAASADSTQAPSAEVKVTGVTLDVTEQELSVNGTISLNANVEPITATNTKLSWSSDNSEIASVDSMGKVTAKKVGEAIITVKSEDGGYTKTCKITVKEATQTIVNGFDVSVTNALDEYSDASNKDYVTITGNDVNVKVRVMKDGKPVGNKDVKLELVPQYGNLSTKAAKNLYYFANKGSFSEKTTNADGYVEFPIYLNNTDYDEAQVSKDIYQSYSLNASYAGSNNVEGKATLSFGCIDLDDSKGTDVYVMNEIPESNLPELVVGDNASKSGDSGVYTMLSEDGLYSQKYVTSQQVSKKAGNIDHSVTFAIDPILQLPAKASDVEKGYYEQALTFASGSYSVYNDETNESTTTKVTNIPAGLSWARIDFSKISISKYTKLSVKFYNAETNALIEEDVFDVDSLDPNALSAQVDLQPDMKTYAVISLISEGQIDTDNRDGYVLSRIFGKYATENYIAGKTISLENLVEWGIDSKFQHTSDGTKTLTAEQASKYLPTDCEYYPTYDETTKTYTSDYKYRYTVPGFPSAANAYISIEAPDKESTLKAVYSYPTKSVFDDDNDKYNQVVIEDPEINGGQKAVYIENKAATKKAADAVGTVKKNGNTVTVDSENTGCTPLTATIDLSKFNIDGRGTDEVYTSVQWAPLPKQQIVNATDFYALEGQNVVVTAQLIDDTNNNEVSQAGEHIKFKVPVTDETNADSEIEAILSKYVQEFKQLDTTTDGNGQVQMTLSSSEDYRYLEQLTAESDRYDVRLIVGGQTVEAANIHWVDAGLYFKDQADSKDADHIVRGNEVSEFSGESSSNIDSRIVTDKWLVGMKVIGNLPVADQNTNLEITNISGVTVDFAKSGVGTGENTTTNGVYSIVSNDIGKTTIAGSIDDESVTDASNVVFTIYEYKKDKNGEYVKLANGDFIEENYLTVTEAEQYTADDRYKKVKKGDFRNVGVGKSTINAKINLSVEWTKDGFAPSIESPLGWKLDTTTATTVYVKLTDKQGNILANQTGKYQITSNEFANMVVAETEITTDENGLVAINLPAPGGNKAGTITIKCQFGKDSDVEFASENITYTVAGEGKAAFAASEAKLDRTGATHTIAVKFSTHLNKNLVNTKAFTLTDAAGKNYEIASAEVDAQNADTVILTLKDTGLNNVDVSTLTLTIDKYVIKHQTYRLTDDANRALADGVTLNVSEVEE